MKYSKFALALAGALLIAAPVLADVTDSDIAADRKAIAKDNAALAHDHKRLEHDRALKAGAKADDRDADQAGDSMAIGKDKAEIHEKLEEKKADEKILHHDEHEMNEQNGQ